MNFGQAIEALKQGKAVQRAGWNGKNMFIFLNKGAADFSNPAISAPNNSDKIEGVHHSLFEGGDVGIVTRLPNINMRTANGSTVTGWLASQTDILAEDWEVVLVKQEAA